MCPSLKRLSGRLWLRQPSRPASRSTYLRIRFGTFRHAYAGSRRRFAHHPSATRTLQARTLDRLSTPVTTPLASHSQPARSDRSVTARRSKTLQETDEAMSRPTLEVADIVRTAGNSFLEQQQAHLAWPHRRVLDAIVRCRTAALGGHRDQCVRCGHQAKIG